MEPHFLIGPERVAPQGAGRMAVVNPNTAEPLAEIACAGEADIARALSAAAAAQKAWWAATARDRAAVLHALATRLETADRGPLLDTMGAELGKVRPDAAAEVEQAIPSLRYFAELARHDQGHVAGPTYTNNIHLCQYDPYGITLHMTPFNYPVLLLCWTMGASLAAGNAVIVKPSEKASLTTLAFMGLFEGLPPGLVSCLTGGAETARALIAAPGIGKVAFTGSTETARAVYRLAAEHFKPCLIEAGGSDPLIVADSADPDVAAAATVNAAFFYAGQVCTSAERVYVHEAVHDAYLSALGARTEALRLGPADSQVDVGPLIDEASLGRVEALVAGAVADGARIVCGGRRAQTAHRGWFYEPTVLADCREGMAIFGREIFGPVVAVSKVASVEEAIRRANDSSYGLGASILTENLDEAMSAAAELEAGMVWINNPLIDNDALPFGGRKGSGFGRELGRAGLDEFRQPKMVVIDHRPRHHDWWMPYRY